MATTSQISRRGLITGLIALVAAPAIVRAGSLMPVKVTIEPVEWPWKFPAFINGFGVIHDAAGARWYWEYDEGRLRDGMIRSETRKAVDN